VRRLAEADHGIPELQVLEQILDQDADAAILE
jgi:hypothetical protein